MSTNNRVLIQTGAIFLDAYRDMNSRKMFWIVMILTAVAIAVFGLIGANDHALTFLGWDIPYPTDDAKLTYKSLFGNLVISWYMTWIAAILALVSTASIFPEFQTGGAVDLYLSKPVGRIRLFATKYLSGLLFALLQLTVFTVGSFIVFGLRAGSWEPSLFLAIPIVLLSFSYIFGICVLFGVLTRSTMAALLLTLLAWSFIGAVDLGDWVLTTIVARAPLSRAIAARNLQIVDEKIAALEHPESAPKPETMPARPGMRVTMGNEDPATLKFMRERFAEDSKKEVDPGWVLAQKIVVGVKTFLPKTRETTNLLDRYLLPSDSVETAENARLEKMGVIGNNDKFGMDVIDPLRARSPWWIAGTSLGFEFACVGLAAWIFKRRDF